MRRPCVSAWACFAALLGVGFVGGGCAAVRRSAESRSGAEEYRIIVPGELVRPTGSRISRVVPKNGPAGVARDMPGFISGSGYIGREQADMMPQKPMGP